jgi:hypothetical protein
MSFLLIRSTNIQLRDPAFPTRCLWLPGAAYALLESEASLAARAVGLEASMGIFHVDQPNRDSLACDLMEPVRPQVDAYLLDWITTQPLKREWFFEQSNGNARLMSSLTERLSETAPTWARAVAPVAEWVLNDLHGRTMVNIVSGQTFHIYDKNSSSQPRPSGWLSLRTMEDEINHILSRAESKFCTPNGSTCTSRTVGLLVRRHIVAGEFHYIGKEASTRWAGGVDLSMMAEAGSLDPADETFREYERVVDPKYLDQIRTQAKQFSTKRLSRQSRVAECAIRSFKNGKNAIKPCTLRKLTKAIHALQNKSLRN